MKKKQHRIAFILTVINYYRYFFVVKNTRLLHEFPVEPFLIIFQWFEHCEMLDTETAANINKFRGDHKYYNKQYEEALSCYRQALGWFQFN